MAITLVANTEFASPNQAGGTTGSINTTGATLLVIHVSDNNGTSTVSDNKGNTWLTGRAPLGGSPYSGIYYAENPTVGSGHTFTVTATVQSPNMQVMAFSGTVIASVKDQSNGTSLGSPASSIQPGSVTPTEDNELVVTGCAHQDTSATTPTIAGYTITDWQEQVSSAHYGGAAAYAVQTTATATNPTWASKTSFLGATIVTFKAATGPSLNKYTELEWSLRTQSPAATTDVYEFRVYAGSTPLDTYAVTAQLTIGSGSGGTVTYLKVYDTASLSAGRVVAAGPTGYTKSGDYTTASFSTTAGRLLVACIRYDWQDANITANIPTPVTSGLTWVKKAEAFNTGVNSCGIQIWMADNPSGGSITVSQTRGDATNWESNTNAIDLTVLECTGALALSSQTATAAAEIDALGAPRTPTNLGVEGLAAMATGDLVVAVAAGDVATTTTITNGSGWTEQSDIPAVSSGADGTFLRSQVQTRTGSTSTTVAWADLGDNVYDYAMAAVTVLAGAATGPAADPATITLTGQDVTPTGTGTATVAADVATLSLTGQTPTAAGTGTATTTADVATLTLTGQDVTATGGTAGSTTADVATVTLTGQDVTVSGSGTATVAADVATLALAGQGVTSTGTGTATVAADVATLALSGQDVTPAGTGTATVTADVALLALQGLDVGVGGGAVSNADVAALTLTGQDVTVTGSGTATTTADVAVISLTGQDATASGSGTVTAAADQATVALTGQTPTAAGTGTATTAADVASLTLTGQDVTALLPGLTVAGPATLTLTGQNVTVSGTGTVTRAADPAVITLFGVTPGEQPMVALITCRVTGAALSRRITGPSNAPVVSVTGPSNQPVASVTGPALRRSLTGPAHLTRVATGPGIEPLTVTGPDVRRDVTGPAMENQLVLVGPGVCDGD